MQTVVGVRFKRTGKVYYFDPGEIDLDVNDPVIVETARGLEYGQVVVGRKQVQDEDVVQPLRKVVRVATPEDLARIDELSRKERRAFDVCLQKIAAHGLPMKLVDVEYTFDNSKIVYYFTAEGRVDFRELVKDLAATFKTRIELRQIGVRDEAKMVGGLGPCGRPLCCATFLGDFEPVSIRMAKEQDLPLNPMKISGICGRLMCCLKYEACVYRETRAKLPPVGSEVETPEGRGRVVSLNILRQKVKVQLQENEKVTEFDAKDVARRGPRAHPAASLGLPFQGAGAGAGTAADADTGAGADTGTCEDMYTDRGADANEDTHAGPDRDADQNGDNRSNGQRNES